MSLASLWLVRYWTIGGRGVKPTQLFTYKDKQKSDTDESDKEESANPTPIASDTQNQHPKMEVDDENPFWDELYCKLYSYFRIWSLSAGSAVLSVPSLFMMYLYCISITITFPRLYVLGVPTLINNGRASEWTRKVPQLDRRTITPVSIPSNNWRVSICIIIILEPQSAHAYLSSAPPDRERTNRLLETLPSITERELEKLGHRGILYVLLFSAISLINH